MPPENLPPIEVTCPCCETRLTLDRNTGAILLEKRPRKGPHRTLDEAAQEAASKKEQAQAQLRQAMDEARHRAEILEKKFREARKKAEDDDSEPPPRPFDLD